MKVALAGEPHSLMSKATVLIDVKKEKNVEAPGDAKACREAEIPVTEDGKARRAAKSTLGHALPDTIIA